MNFVNRSRYWSLANLAGRTLFAAAFMLLSATSAQAQNGRAKLNPQFSGSDTRGTFGGNITYQRPNAAPRMHTGPVIPNLGIPPEAPTRADYSWIEIEKPPPRPLRIHDILTITVDDKSELIVDNRFNRSRISQLKAELKEFIRINNRGNLDNAAANGPTIDSNLQSRLNSQGQIQSSEGIKYIVAATVVDIRPNGNLVLEAKKRVRVNKDVWEYRLTGEIRPEKVNRDFTAISEDIADMYIEKNQVGKVQQSVKRPWGVVLYDLLSPF